MSTMSQLIASYAEQWKPKDKFSAYFDNLPRGKAYTRMLRLHYSKNGFISHVKAANNQEPKQ